MLGGSAALAAAALIIISAAASPAYGAEAEDDNGFYLGLKLMGSSLHVDEDEEAFIEDDGGGIQLDIGYRFNPTFALELGLGGATHETTVSGIDAQFMMVHILAFYRFVPDGPFRPYIKGGVGGYGLRVEEDSASTSIEGAGLAIGGGFRYFFDGHFAIGLDLTHNIIHYDKGQVSLGGFSVETELDEDGSQTSLGLTFSYSF